MPIENYADYIPIWSTYTNGKEIIEEIFHLDIRTSGIAHPIILSEPTAPSNPTLEDREVTHLKDKSNTRRIVALFPFVGNLLIAIYDLTSSLYHSYQSYKRDQWAKETLNNFRNISALLSPTVRSFLKDLSKLDDDQKRDMITLNLQVIINQTMSNFALDEPSLKIICKYSHLPPYPGASDIELSMLKKYICEKSPNINEHSKNTITQFINSAADLKNFYSIINFLTESTDPEQGIATIFQYSDRIRDELPEKDWVSALFIIKSIPADERSEEAISFFIDLCKVDSFFKVEEPSEYSINLTPVEDAIIGYSFSKLSTRSNFANHKTAAVYASSLFIETLCREERVAIFASVSHAKPSVLAVAKEIFKRNHVEDGFQMAAIIDALTYLDKNLLQDEEAQNKIYNTFSGADVSIYRYLVYHGFDPKGDVRKKYYRSYDSAPQRPPEPIDLELISKIENTKKAVIRLIPADLIDTCSFQPIFSSLVTVSSDQSESIVTAAKQIMEKFSPQPDNIQIRELIARLVESKVNFKQYPALLQKICGETTLNLKDFDKSISYLFGLKEPENFGQLEQLVHDHPQEPLSPLCRLGIVYILSSAKEEDRMLLLEKINLILEAKLPPFPLKKIIFRIALIENKDKTIVADLVLSHIKKIKEEHNNQSSYHEIDKIIGYSLNRKDKINDILSFFYRISHKYPNLAEINNILSSDWYATSSDKTDSDYYSAKIASYYYNDVFSYISKISGEEGFNKATELMQEIQTPLTMLQYAGFLAILSYSSGQKNFELIKKMLKAIGESGVHDNIIHRLLNVGSEEEIPQIAQLHISNYSR